MPRISKVVLRPTPKVGDMTTGGRRVESERWEPPAFLSSPADPPVPAAPHQARTVLVVDDKHSVRTSIAAVLRSEGYDVTEVWDGQDAVPLLKGDQFDAMVLDLRMPLVGGASLLAALTNPPPTVILSATEMTGEDRARVGEAVMAELTKPVAPRRLLDAVAAAVGRGKSPD
jgi:CheY-like chemotaxis protein